MTIIDSITEDTPSIESGGTGTFMLTPEQIAGITNDNGNGHTKWVKPNYTPTDASGRAALEGDVATLAHIAGGLGIAVCPPKQDGSKAPDATDWKEATREDFTVEAIDQWYAEKPLTGFGIFTGAKLSKGLVMTELEGRAVGAGAMDALLATAIVTGNEDVFIKATTGYMSDTPSTGLHWLHWVPQLEAKCQKFASCLKWHIQKKEWVVKGLAESKGLGGFTIEAGTHGTVHKSGRPYKLLSGSLETIKTWSVDEYERWCALLGTLDRRPDQEVEKAKVRESRTDDRSLPGNDFNAHVSWAEVLEPAGWNRAPESKGRDNWYKPNNCKGAPHASVNQTDLLYVWSTACELEGNQSYSKFAAYAYLSHDGDFAAATKALAGRGYGQSNLQRESLFIERAGSTSAANQSTPDANVYSGTDGPAEWPELEALDAFERPSFPTDALPDVLADFTRALAVETSTREDLAGMLTLNAVSLILARKVEVVEPWREPVNLYTCVCLLSGERKSPVFSQVYGPISQIEKKHVEASESDRFAGIAARDQMVEFAKKDMKAARSSGDAESYQEASRAFQAAEALPIAAPPRLLAGDLTPETLPAMLAAQGGRIGIISDEGGIFETIAGRYASGVPNLDVMLQAHDGSSPIREDRVGRGPQYVERPTITFGLTVQPEVLQKIATNNDFKGRGFSARWLWAMPGSDIGHRPISPPKIPLAIAQGYRDLLQSLDTIELLPDTPAIKLRLSDGARKLFEEFQRAHEVRLRPDGDFHSMQAWANKHCGAILRIAALFHLIESGQRDPDDFISEVAMMRALALSPYLVEHARIALDTLGLSEEHTTARRILTWIESTRKSPFSLRDIEHDLKMRKHDVEKGLVLLIETGHIRSANPTARPKVGRPSVQFEVNPQLLGPTEDTTSCG